MPAIATTRSPYQGPDRRGGGGMRGEMGPDDCREQARICFAQAVAAVDPEERERYCERGEHWMTRCRNWAPRGFTSRD